MTTTGIEIYDQLYDNLHKEIGKELTVKFLTSMKNMSFKEIKQVYFDFGKTYGELILHWRNWIIKNADFEPYLIMRDAKILHELEISKNWKQVYINRKLCGIEDEIAEFNTNENSLLTKYITQNGLDKEFTFVDTGCYGSIVKKLHEGGMSFQPLFFFSHNPNIKGFLNELNIDLELAEIFNDSIETTFLNAETTANELYEMNEIIIPRTKKINSISSILGNQALFGLRQAKEISLKKAIENAINLNKKAKNGVFSGMLPESSPSWSLKNEFLESWPNDLNWNKKEK